MSWPCSPCRGRSGTRCPGAGPCVCSLFPVVLAGDGAVRVGDAQFRDEHAKALLEALSFQEEGQKAVTECLDESGSQGHDPSHATGVDQDPSPDFASFAGVGVEQRSSRRASVHECQFPGEVAGILHAGIHALSTCW